MIFTPLKAKAMILSLIAAFIVGAFVSLAVMKLRMDALNSSHLSAVTALAKQHADQITALRVDHQAAVDKRTEEVRAEQAAITATYEKALNDSRTRQAALQSDLLRSRAAADSLRQQARLASSRINLPETSGVSIAEYALAINELLDACSTEYTAMAGAADGHAADARTLKEAWPAPSPKEHGFQRE